MEIIIAMIFYKDRPKHWSKQYFSLIERQMGIFSYEDQEKIKNTHIAILGASAATLMVDQLVRLGCENFTICDYDKWEHSNMGRLNIFLDDIGKYKVDTIEESAKKINPDVKIRKFFKLTQENVSQILDGVEIACIMLDDVVSVIIAARECRKRNINFVQSPTIPFIFSFWFTKDSIAIEEFFGIPSNKPIDEIEKNLERIMRKVWRNHAAFPYLLEKYQRNIDGFKRMGERKYRSCAMFTHFNMTNLAFEIIFSGILKLKEMRAFPNITVFDYFDWKLYPLNFSLRKKKIFFKESSDSSLNRKFA